MGYAVVIQKRAGGWHAHVPDLPDCTAEAATVQEAKAGIAKAIRSHVARLERDGQKVPEATSVVDHVEL
jgi:predicted RNase H-like HicB family nuclease